MLRRNSGLLISQLLECLGGPLTEEQVWGLCYEICKSLVDTSNKDTIADEHGRLSCTRVVFQLDTMYLRKEGGVAFVLDENPPETEGENEDTLKQMSSFGKLLMACLENGVSEFGKRQIGDDLETLMRHMTKGNLKDTHGHWVHLVSDYCVHHATPQNVPVSEYYRQLCKILVSEALEMSNFLEVLKNEFVLLRSHDALCTLQLFQTRPTVRRWLQVMSELREDFSRAHVVPVRSPESPLCFVTMKDIYSQPGPHEIQSPPRSEPTTRPSLIRSTESLQLSKNLGKPAYFSTPAASCKPARKVLRPPQRLVDQVTNWMLEAEDWGADNTSGFRTPTSVNKSGHWSELDSQGFDHDFSWSSGQQPSRLTSALGWYRETKRIRRVLTELQLDTVMEDDSLFDALHAGKICFCCRHTKFSLFTRWGVVCDTCERKVCGTCVVYATPRDLGITSPDQVDAHHGRRVLKQIRRAFKSKPTDNEKYINICKDCRDFVQRFH